MSQSLDINRCDDVSQSNRHHHPRAATTSSSSSFVVFKLSLLFLALIASSLLLLSSPLSPSIILPVFGQSASTNCTASGRFCYGSTLALSDVIQCTLSMYCPGGQSAALCAKGFYCPTVLLQLPCPSGWYCPPATVSPRPCSPLAYCPIGSYRYFNWSYLLLLIVIMPLIAFGRPLRDVVQKQWRARRRGRLSQEDGDASAVAASASLELVPRLDVEFNNLRATVDVNGVAKVILANVSGKFRSGRLTAIMGPSGCGKSSLLTLLTGGSGIALVGGSIASTIDGRPISHEQLRRARQVGLIGLVPQDDVMIPSLTPHDILTHSAFARLPSSFTSAEKYARVQRTLDVVQLSHVQHTPAGDERARGLSGGEKKRTSIGIELVNAPAMLLLDEPTSGLDTSSSHALIRTLLLVASLRTTVVAVLHQPRSEIFAALDDLLLLAPGGFTVYFGPANETQAYFARIGFKCNDTTNFADFAIDCIAGLVGGPRMKDTSETKDGAAPSAIDDTLSNPQRRSKKIDITATSTASSVRRRRTKLPAMTPVDVQRYLIDRWSQHITSSQSIDDASDSSASYQPGRFSASIAPSSSSLSLLSSSPVEESKEATISDVDKPFAVGDDPIANRCGPSFLKLTYLYAYRGALQSFRCISTTQTEMMMHILAGLVIGMAFVDSNWFLPPIPASYLPYTPAPMQASVQAIAVRDVVVYIIVYTVMALGLVAAIIGNRCFGGELTNLRRESESGANIRAYCIGKMIAEVPFIVLYAFLFTISYFLVCSPASTFASYLCIMVLLEFVLFGIGSVCSLLLTDNALLLSSICALVSGLGTDNDGTSNLCWARWAGEAIFIAEARIDLLKPPTDAAVQTYWDATVQYNGSNYGTDILVLFIMGVTLRVIAAGLMWRTYRQ